MNWIDIQQRVLDIQQNSFREPVTSISSYFIYINQQQYIDKIVAEEIIRGNDEISDDFRIPFTKVLHIIQSKRYVTSTTKYIFKEAALFHIDLEPEHIQGFSNEDKETIQFTRFFRVLSPTEDIVIPPSIFIFHSTNALYFFFHEVTLPVKCSSIPKSILKKTIDNKPNQSIDKIHNVTKKVTIKVGKGSFGPLTTNSFEL